MKIGKIDRKMHKIKKYSLQEHLIIPNSHFISHFSQQIKLSNSEISLHVHYNYFKFAYSDNKYDLYLFSAQCYMMVRVDSMKHLIRHVHIPVPHHLKLNPPPHILTINAN